MKQMVTDPAVNKVLVVCDERYATKADGRAGGVGTETQIISKDVYDKVRQEKFITLVRERDGEGKEFLPIYLRNRKYIDFSKDDDFGESYDALLRVLFGRPELKKPQLGKPPAHLFVEGATDVKVAGKLERLKDAVKRERPYAHTALQEYLDLFADSLEDFRLAYDPKAPVPFDDQVVASISAFTPYRDSFVECMLFLAAYMNDPDAYDRVFAFLEAILPFRDRPEKMSSYYQVSFDNYRFILYELFLYLVAGLIKTRRYTAAVRFMNGEYHFTESLGGTRYRKERADVFNNPVASLDEQRNQRLKLNRYSVLADLIVERATHPKLGKADLMQADFLLFFRPYLLGESDGRGWYPRCIGYAPQIGTFEIFAKATSAHGFEAARQILKVKDLSDLDARIRAAFKTPQLARYLQSERFLYTSIEELLNLQGIARQLGSKV